MTPRQKFAAIVVALAAAATGGRAVVRASDDCVLVQVLSSDQNAAALVARGYGHAELVAAGVDLPRGAVVHIVLCGDDLAGLADLTDAQVVGPAGSRGLTGDGVGAAGKTADEVRAGGRWAKPIGIAFRCAPDPDRPGRLNAACNSECVCNDDKARAQADALGIVYDCGLWRASGRDCREGVP